MSTIRIPDQRTRGQTRGTGRAKVACQNCRQKKKRCDHGLILLQSDDDRILLNFGPRHIVDLESGSSSSSRSSSSLQDEDDHLSFPKAPTEIDRQSGVVSPQVSGQDSAALRRPVTILTSEAHYSEASLHHQHDPRDRDNTGVRPDGKGNGDKFPDIPQARHTYGKTDAGCLTDLRVEDEGLLPPSSTQAILIGIYFSRIQPILPIVEEATFRKAYTEQSVPTILVQAICLVAAKDDHARHHLYLTDHSKVLAPRPFAKRLYTSIVLAINSNVNHNKVILIQSLALVSLHTEGYDGAEKSSMHLAQAIHHAQTIGLHRKYIQGNPEQPALKRLFWCLWTLDRWNAAINRRPVLINDKDHSLDMNTGAPGDKAFLVWLSIAVMLDDVIYLYRPSRGSTKGWDEKFPSFRGILEKHNGFTIEPSLLESLELSYHAVAVLACKPNSPKDNHFSTPSHDRQVLSALSIASIASIGSYKTLAPLPILPYAVALSLSVAYKKLYHSTQATHKERAKEELEKRRKILKDLSETWWSACTWYKFDGKILGDSVGGLLDLDFATDLDDPRRFAELISGVM